MSIIIQMNRYSNIGKEGLIKEGVFVRFPELIPARTENYWKNSYHKKLLIIGESNYFEDNTDSVFKNPEAWYKEDTQHLIPENKKSDVSNWKGGYKTFNTLCKSINEVSNAFHCDNVYDEAMFYNYFLRPATVCKSNKSFKKDCTQIDRDIAGSTLCEILEIDKPDIVIFISKYAFDEFKKYVENVGCKLSTQIDYVNHPAVHFSWNHRNGNGKQKFEKLLKEYWIK